MDVAATDRQGLGATIRVALADGRQLSGMATTAVGYASSSEAVVRFGLGSQGSAQVVEVRWPGGKTQVVREVAGDRVIEIEEAP